MRQLLALIFLFGLEVCAGLRLIPAGYRIGPRQVQQIGKVSGAIASSFFLIGAPINLINDAHEPITLIRPAVADFRAQQKRTFFRYSPKLSEGGIFLKKDVKNAIDNNDWKVIEKMFEEYASKMNGSQKDQVDQTDTYVNNHFLRPMTLLAGSFAERGTSAKQRGLMEQEEVFSAAMLSLEGCVKDTPGQGFFASPIKAPTGSARNTQANAALAAATKAYNEYVTQMNTGLMLELNKLETI